MDKKDARFEFRLTKQELTELRRRASEKGISAGDFLRQYIRRSARRK